MMTLEGGFPKLHRYSEVLLFLGLFGGQWWSRCLLTWSSLLALPGCWKRTRGKFIGTDQKIVRLGCLEFSLLLALFRILIPLLQLLTISSATATYCTNATST